MFPRALSLLRHTMRLLCLLSLLQGFVAKQLGGRLLPSSARPAVLASGSHTWDSDADFLSGELANTRVVSGTLRLQKAWLPNTRVDSSSSNAQGNVSMAFDSAGRLYAAWTETSAAPNAAILVSSSADGGSHWSSPVQAAAGSSYSWNLALAPGAGGKLYLAWESGEDIRFAASADGGLSWSSPRTINDDTTRAKQFDPSLAVDSSGNLYLAWTDSRKCSGETCYRNVYFSRSTDGGQTWSQNQNLTSGVTSNGHHYRPRLAAGAAGRLYLAWLDCSIATTARPDLYFSISNDGGQTWQLSGRVNDVDQSIDINYPFASLQLGPNGEVYLAWPDMRNSPDSIQDVYFDRSLDGGLTWGTDIRINDQLRPKFSGQPALAVSLQAADGEPGMLTAAWIDGRSGGSAVYAATSVDRGQTWSANQRVDDQDISGLRWNPAVAAWQDPIVAWTDPRLGSNRLYQSRFGYASGSYLSSVLDAGQISTWNSLAWTATQTISGSLLLTVRTGNTPVPDDSWTGWFYPPASPASLDGLRAGRYFQWRMLFATGDPAITPALDSLRVAWSTPYLTSLDLTGPAEASVNQPVQLSAGVSPATLSMPIIYRWQASGQASVTHTAGLTDTMAFTWADAGEQVITVTADNGFNSLQQVLNLHTVFRPPTQVSLKGVQGGTVQRQYTFTAAASPQDASIPLTYTWEADGQAPIVHPAGLNDQVSYHWDQPGSYTVHLTAANPGGQVQAAWTVNIFDFLPVCAEGCAYTSLQAAIQDASAGGVIRLAAGDYRGVNSLGGQNQVAYIDKPLTIQGGFPATFAGLADPWGTPSRVDGQGLGRGFTITGSGPVTLEGLQILNGLEVAGGGIHNSAGLLRLKSCRVANNQVSGNPAQGGGIYNAAGSRLEMAETQVESNQAVAGANTVPLAGSPGQGGGVYNAGMLSVETSALLSNLAQGGPGQKGAAGWDGVGGEAGSAGTPGTEENEHWGGDGGDGGVGGPGGTGQDGSPGAAGGIGQGGGIFNAGVLTLTNSTLASNIAQGGPGGMGGSGGAGGLGGPGGAGGKGGNGLDSDQLHCRGGGDGGNGGNGGPGGTGGAGGSGGPGGMGEGSGLYNTGLLTVINATLADNQGLAGVAGAAGLPGAAGPGGPGGSGGAGGLPSCPAGHIGATGKNGLSGSAGQPGAAGGSGLPGSSQGAGLFQAPGQGAASLHNTLLAENTALKSPDCSGSLQSLGYNLVQEAAGCSLGQASSDHLGQPATLGGLQNNGGHTLTLEPLTGSLAIDGGDPSFCPLTDQRGLPRRLDGDLNGSYRCDIGAVEVQAGSPPPSTYTLFLPAVRR